MKRGLKILGIIVAIPVLLFIVAAIMLVTLDLNEYRKPIAERISEATGRELILAGDLEKTFFPWLGVKIGGVELSNAPGFADKTFARLQNIDIRMDTLSLLRLQPEIGKVVVHGLQLNLARKADGNTNWDDLLQQEQIPPGAVPEQSVVTVPEPGLSKPSDTLRDIKVGGIEIRNAQLKWDDLQSNASYEVQRLDVTVSEIALGTPLTVDVAASVKSSAPAMQANVAMNSGALQWDLDQRHFYSDRLQLTIQAQGEMLPGKKAELNFQSPIELHLQNATFSLAAIAMQLLDIEIKGKLNAEQIIAAPAFSGNISIASLNPRQLFATLGIDAPQTADPQVLQKASVSFGLGGDGNQLNLKPLNIVLDDTHVKGNVGVKHFANPVIAFKLNVDAIDVDRYLLPASESKPVQTKAAGKPPVPEKTAEDTPLPLEPLRALNVNGQLKVGTLTASKVITNDLLVDVKASKGLIHLKPVSGKVSGGSFASDIKLDARGEQLKVALKETITNVQVEPLLKALIDNDLLSGAVKLNADVKSQGKTSKQLMEGLQGVLDFQFNNGAIKGFNLAEYGRQGKALIKGQSYKPSDELQQTDFTELAGKAKINNGVVDNTELKGKSPAIRLEGNGKVDLLKQTIDYLLTGYIVGTSKGQGGAELSDLKGLPIPIRIKGSYTELQYDFDERAFRKAFTDKYKKQLKAKEQELKQKLDEKKQAEIEKQKQRLKEEEAKLKKKLEEKLKKLF